MNLVRTPDPGADLSYLLEGAAEASAGRGMQLDVRYFLNLLLRFRWLVIAPFCLAMVAGIYLAATLPRTYRSEATILVEPQSVPDKYVHATVPVEIDARIASLAQQILSSSNLADLIERFKLFTAEADQGLVLEEKIEKMRSRLRVRIADEELGKGKRTGARASAFTISYEDSDPRKVFQVANAMANFVIDQNLKMRESHAFGTSDFLNSELAKMRGRLEEVEKTLEEYRRVYMGELPEQLPSNLTILERLQQQLGQGHQTLRDEKNRLVMVESQLKFAQQAAAPSAPAVLPPSADGGPKTLEGLRQQLADFQAKYTENHPDVVILKKKIEALDQEAAQAAAPDAAPKGAKSSSAGTGAGSRPFLQAELMGQQQAILRNIQAVEAEIPKIQAQIEHYQRRVENTPKREQELLLLKRDYDNIKSTYSSVLNRKLEADIALNMEKTQKGEQFRILDPPRTAEKPISPNLKMILMACVAVGLGVGGGGIFLIEFLDRSVRSPETLQSRLALPVLMVMPTMAATQAPRTRLLGRLNSGLSVFGVLVCLGLLAVLASITVLDAPRAAQVIMGILK